MLARVINRLLTVLQTDNKSSVKRTFAELYSKVKEDKAFSKKRKSRMVVLI